MAIVKNKGSKAEKLAAAAEKVERRGSRKFKKISAPDIFKFENVGESIEGEYQGKRIVERKADGSDAFIYDLTTDEGKKIAFWGSGFLNPTMESVEIGDYIRITLVELREPSEEDLAENPDLSPAKIFDVEVAE